MKIILSGGGTMGSVSPLLAIAEELSLPAGKAGVKSYELRGMSIDKLGAGKERNSYTNDSSTLNFLWLGTRQGPEKKVVEEAGIKFKTILAGKFRRYFSLRNLFDPLFIIIGWFQSLGIIIRFKPDAILTAGGFVAVPVVWAGRFCRIPCFVHQQDAVVGLANKLMAPFAARITVVSQDSLKDFPNTKVVQTGNPVRSDILSGERGEANKFFNLEKDLPTLLVMGGGTGALTLNNILVKNLPELVKFCQVIHLTGAGKSGEERRRHVDVSPSERYHSFEFLMKEMPLAYAVADLVVSRGGMGFLSELAVSGKPIIIVPMPNTHQEANAEIFAEHQAALVWPQRELTGENFAEKIKEVLSNKKQLESLAKNIQNLNNKDAAKLIAKEVVKVIKK